jgi:phage terminase large subunit GpA-like protein
MSQPWRPSTEIPRGFVPPDGLIARAAHALIPPERLDVHQAALRHRFVANGIEGYRGPWTDDATPYLVRPMLALTDRRYRMVVLMGPAQSGKSSLGENWLVSCVVVDQGPILWVGPDKKLLQDYVTQKVNPLIRNSDAVRARQLRGGSADNIFSKEFLGDMWINFIWPVASNFRMRTAPRWVIDDYDAVPADIEGEGDPIFLLGGRTTAHERSWRGLVMSSPARKRGFCDIEHLAETGTDEAYHWPCAQCGDFFAPDFDRDLKFERTRSPEDAASSAHLVCPTHGCVLDYRHKARMNAAGIYVGAGQSIDRATGQVAGDLKRTHIASFRVNGLMGFNSWQLLARECRTAEIAFEQRQDETSLRTFFNTKIGVNYRSRAEGEGKVSKNELMSRAEDFPLGLVPAGARFLTAAVDVQGNRFAVAVMGWGDDDEMWLIDRFDLLAMADGRTAIRPHKELAHWDSLIGRAVGGRTLGLGYPLADDPAMELPVACTAIDIGGLAGVDERARNFARKLIHGLRLPAWSVMLVKGANLPTAPMLGRPKLETDDNGKRRKDAVAINVIGVHAIKDALDVCLHTAEPGAGFVHLSEDMDEQHFDEILGEEKQGPAGSHIWVRTGRNETWDLMVYDKAAALRLRTGPRIDWANPPVWAKPRRRGIAANAVRTDPANAAAAPQAPAQPRKRAAVRVLNKGV